MSLFKYKAKDLKGADFKGEVEGRDEKQALKVLREKNYYPYYISEKKDNVVIQTINHVLKGVSIADIAIFTRQLSTMVSAGLPLTDALLILKNQGKEDLSKAISSILKDVQGGSSLADSMQKFPKIFSPVYVALVRAGEAAGVLDNVLARLSDNLESQREFQAKIKGALMYPAIIILGMGGVMFIMMMFVIPKLTSMYKEFNATLPATTLILIGVSTFMVKFWWLVLIGLVGLVYLYKLINSTRKGKRGFDSFKFKIPIVGKLQKEVILAEITRTLGLLVGAGVSINEALEISSKTANNVLIEEGVLDSSKKVEKGLPMSLSFSENPVFPQILSQMLSVGEETGKMDEVLLKVSHFFQSESEESLKGLTTAIEPLIMIILGVAVGFLIIAIIMPIYSLTSQIQ